MSEYLDQDASLLQDYLMECEELLQQLDQDLVTLEASPEDSELLNRIFRAFHTIKGTSGFMGFTAIVELTHHAEDVLNLLRKGDRKVDRHTMDVLLEALDQLRIMIADVRANKSQQYELGPLLAKLRELQAPQNTDVPPPAEALPGAQLGVILSDQNIVTQTQIQSSLAEAAQTSQKLGEVLVEKGLASETQVKEALTQQKSGGEAKETTQTIRVEVSKLDDLINLVGELVLERNRLVQLARDFSQERFTREAFDSAFGQSTVRLSFITEELQVRSLNARMVPIDVVFRKFPRMVRDVSKNLSKEIELVIRGEDTELDKTVVEQIGDPLVHLIRNSLDHGIERPEVRERNGKPRQGRIRLEAHQEGDHIIVSVADDGAGIDPERVVRKAIERGMLTAERAATMSKGEILNIIFLPGFSTAEIVSDVSGRGVGMDVVRTNLKKLHGVVELDSELGKGSCVTLKLPLTLAIMPVLLVRVREEVFALPLRSVMETVRVPEDSVHEVSGNPCLCLRDRVIPLIYLDKVFSLTHEGRSKDGMLRIVVIGIGETRFGVVVDQLLGQEETVIKPLGSYLGSVAGVAGATISGDGSVRLILDPAGLAGIFSGMLS
jgi:two-component system chemotaxis sensor kinase CheA